MLIITSSNNTDIELAIDFDIEYWNWYLFFYDFIENKANNNGMLNI